MGVHRKENLVFKKCFFLFIYQWETTTTTNDVYLFYSLSLSFLPPYSLVVFVILTKVKAVLA